MEGQKEIDLSWLPSKGVDLSFLPAPKSTLIAGQLPPSKPMPAGVDKIVFGGDKQRPPRLKSLAQSIISPIEGAVRTAASIPAGIVGLATTLVGQAVSGDWEKGAQAGGAVSNWLMGSGATLGGEKTSKVEEMLSPLTAPFAVAMEDFPRFMAPDEPKTQAMLGTGVGIAMLRAGHLMKEIKSSTPVKAVKKLIWQDKIYTGKEKAAILKDINKAEEAGAKTAADVIPVEPKPTPATPVGPKIEVKAPAGKIPTKTEARKQALLERMKKEEEAFKKTMGEPTEPPTDIPDVYMKMPLDILTKQASAGVEGAKKALTLRTFKGEKPPVERRGPGRISDAEWKAIQEEAKAKTEEVRAGVYKQFQEAGETAVPPSEVKPLSITTEQMKLGLADYEKSLAEQGQGVLGEPRGGGIPVGLLKKPGEVTMELPKRVGPINLERLNLEIAPKKLLADVEDRLHQSRIQARERAGRTWVDAEENANLMGGAYEVGQAIGKSVEEVIEIYGKSTQDLHSKVLAARMVLATSVDKLQKLSKEYMDNPTDKGYAQLQITYNRHAAIQFAVGEGSGNIGRALNIHKKVVSAKDMLLSKGAKEVMKNLGKNILDHESIQFLAALDASNPAGTLKFLAERKPATFRQKAFELWMNSILSNPLTHGVNMTSNFGTMLWRAGETLEAAAIEAMRTSASRAGVKLGIVKEPIPREIYFGEVAYSIIGAFRGVKDGLKIAWEKLKGGLTPDDITKLEIPSHAIKGLKGEVVRVPSKALGAEDSFFKTVIYSDKIYSEAYKAATKEGLRGDARRAKISELVKNPTDAMKATAMHEALYLTFNNKLGNLGKAIMQLRRKTPGLEFIIPFVRTPTNIAKFGVQRTILGAPSLIRESLRGEVPHAELMKRAVSIGTTTGASLALVKLVMDGLVTGSGPKDKRERDLLYAQGWQPRSIKIGGTYYGYGRIEPFSTILGLYTDFYDIRQHATNMEADKIAGLIGSSLKNNLLDKTFFAGLMDLIKGTEDVERFGGSLVKRLSGSVVPAAVAGVARAIDPNLREARTIVETIKGRIPGVSQTVEPKLGTFGEPAKRPGTPVSRMFSPVPISKEIKDPVYTELIRLGMKIGQPTIKGGKEVSRKLAESSMPEVKAAALKVISSPIYRALKTDEAKKKLLQSYMNRTRAFQRGLFMLEGMK